MRLVILSILALVLWAAVIDAGLDLADEDAAHREAVGACMAHTYKTVAQCMEAP